jgi:hypothetical protein
MTTTCLKTIALFAAMLLVGACGGSSPGIGDTDTQDQAGATCEDSVRVLGSLDEASPLVGLSANDLLDEADGGFTADAGWASDTDVLTQSPLGGSTALTVAVTYEGGEIREVDSKMVEDAQDMAVDCPDRLEVDVSIGVSTADGALSETWPAVLSRALSETDGLGAATLAADFDPEALGGTFDIVTIEGVTPDSVTGAFSSTAASPWQGEIDILVQQTSGEGDDGTVSQTRHVALSWGGAGR